MDSSEVQLPTRKRLRVLGLDDDQERVIKRIALSRQAHKSFLPKLGNNFQVTPNSRKISNNLTVAIPLYPDRYRPTYGRTSSRPPPGKASKYPTLNSLVEKLVDVLATEQDFPYVIAYRENPRHLPPHLHAMLCMQEDYINSKVNKDMCYFRMLETYEGRREMIRQARLHIKTTLDRRLAAVRSKRSRLHQELRLYNNSHVVKDEGPHFRGPVFESHQRSFGRSPFESYHLQDKTNEHGLTSIEARLWRLSMLLG